ncbi:SPOR domain-containing protein [Phaeovibrio sulfidiphilus]|uniref:SPOR domain-containing protein n=1 Tax=Phaeovibrio sulfidiphilus TaxID=1220600 RepID=A0A8J7CE73_9PROT|nr:SPOR domain-containing protein [Phaeovibrio sulfidiphilus]MBE1237594.1 SPOR domain-containing protein [Phaeovibrio sulfidiphilus]
MVAQGPPGGDERDPYRPRTPGDVSSSPYGYPRPSDPNNPFGSDPFASETPYHDEFSPFGGQHPLADPLPYPEDDLDIRADAGNPDEPDGYPDTGLSSSPRTSVLALLTGAGLGILVLGGMAWFLLGGTGDDAAWDEALLEHVNADPSPYRERPEEPGGMAIENQNRAVYGRIGETAAPPPASRADSLREPEFPAPPPVPQVQARTLTGTPVPSITEPLDPSADPGFPEPPPLPETDTTASGIPPASALTDDGADPFDDGDAASIGPADIALPPVPPVPDLDLDTGAGSGPAARTQADATATGAAASPETRGTRASPVAVPAPRPVIEDVPSPTDLGSSASATASTQARTAAPKGPTPLAPPPAPPAPPAAAAAPAAPPPRAETPAPARGGAAVQIVSVRSQEAARSEWKRIQSRNKDLLGGATHEIVQVELPERGTYFRVRVTGLKDEAAAKALCDELGRRSQGCIVAR